MKKLAATLLLGTSLTTPVTAEDPDYCSIFSKQWLLTALIHNKSLLEKNLLKGKQKELAEWTLLPENMKYLLDRNYSVCLNSEERLLIPKDVASNEETFLGLLETMFSDVTYTKDQARLSKQNSSTCTLEIREQIALDTLREFKVYWCEENYRSYDSNTGTVIRSANKGKRVPCPFDEFIQEIAADLTP